MRLGCKFTFWLALNKTLLDKFIQPFVDVFSGIYIAQQAEVIVTDFDGNTVKFVDDEETVWDVVATTNQSLHDQVLSAIADCKKKMGA